MKKINEMINIIILLLGFCILLISFFLDDNTKQICNSIATSLIASAIVAFLSSRYIIKQNKISDIINEWNIAGIYETRSKMNDESSNIYLDKLKNEMDIISLGMRSFRDAKGALIEEKVKHGIKLRILTLAPESTFVNEKEKAENRSKGEIKKTIEDLIQWVDTLKDKAPNSNNIQLRIYDSCPLDSYLRIDKHIYIGPNMFGRLSQQTISFEFVKGGKGYSYFHKYFDSLWNNSSFCYQPNKNN